VSQLQILSSRTLIHLEFPSSLPPPVPDILAPRCQKRFMFQHGNKTHSIRRLTLRAHQLDLGFRYVG
jgi:hypothetical protein